METDNIASGERFSSEVLGFMRLAIDQAKLALDSLEVPVGCVIIEDGNVIAAGRNRITSCVSCPRGNRSRGACRHDEISCRFPKSQMLLHTFIPFFMAQFIRNLHPSLQALLQTCESCDL
ncbi:uncharacterized protein LOC104444754 [Eucalyptus grandis]|uniref:uncharacterized protein LOC104444754 n=1 Tax=Eucalyptus grandis TaxID=71139 RepID=UPI00192ED3D2|nr:uncharacterized protein LOC104444754 [Eucalyptus grandis]